MFIYVLRILPIAYKKRTLEAVTSFPKRFAAFISPFSVRRDRRREPMQEKKIDSPCEKV